MRFKWQGEFWIKFENNFGQELEEQKGCFVEKPKVENLMQGVSLRSFLSSWLAFLKIVFN
jgi:hypothetical protein